MVFINPPAIKYAKISVRNNKPPLNKVFVSVPRILYFFWKFFLVSVWTLPVQIPKNGKMNQQKNGRFQIDNPIKKIAKIYRGKGVPLEPAVPEIIRKDLHP